MHIYMCTKGKQVTINALTYNVVMKRSISNLAAAVLLLTVAVSWQWQQE